TGAGKSTLMSLLLRFYDPTSGAILFDGIDLRDIRLVDLMRLSSIVLQEPFLFIDTIANSIRVGRPSATIEEVVAAAIAANVHDDILGMELGYETIVGTGREARGLSGGQKQRICVAAALLKNAPILCLDEATNSLDSVSEAKVQAAIECLMRNRTTFVIAHRRSRRSIPSNRMAPSVGSKKRSRSDSKVDLPAPVGPTIPIVSPRWIRAEIPLSTGWSRYANETL